MRTNQIILGSLLAVTASVVVPGGAGTNQALAQQLEAPRNRQGYYVSASLTTGAAQLREDGHSLGTYAGGGFSLRLGQLLTRRFGLGLTIDSSSAKKKDDLASMFGIGVESQMVLAGNLAMHASIGLGVVYLKDQKDPHADTRGGLGTRYGLGLSYAWFPWKGRKSGGFSVTPTLQGQFIPGDGATAIGGLVGLDLGWWTGLPRNQLDLPESEAY